jgi:hypothetical protein
VSKAIHHLLIVAGAAVLAFLITTPDFDLWARLAIGSIVFQTGHVPRHDIFSYLPTKELWIDHEWGTGVVLYAAAKYVGEIGIFLLKGLLVWATFMMVGRAIDLGERKRSPSPFFYLLLGYALFPGIASLLRSQMFTYFFFAAWLYGLERVRRGERRILWLFPCTMLFWVNMHGGFLAGIGLVLLYAVGDLATRKHPLPYLWILLLVLPVTLVNPYGFAMWRYVVEAARMPRPFILEWQPISLSGPKESIVGLQLHLLTGFFLVFGLTLAGVFRSFVRRQSVDATKVFVVAALFLLSVRHQRHAVFFVLAAGALFYDQIAGLLEPLRAIADKAGPYTSAKIRSVARWVLGYVLPALVMLALVPRLSHRMSVDYRRFPVGALEFIKQNGLAGNLATAFDWGSYASWKLHPRCKVMIDGRYEEVFADDVFDVAIRFAVRHGDWREALGRFPPDIVVLPKTFYTQADLALLPEWRPVYQDFVSVVMLPRDRIAGPYTRPDFRDPAYGREDLAKPIAIPDGSR